MRLLQIGIFEDMRYFRQSMKNYNLKKREKVNTFIFWYKSIKFGCFIWQASSQYSKTRPIMKFYSATRNEIEGDRFF